MCQLSLMAATRGASGARLGLVQISTLQQQQKAYSDVGAGQQLLVCQAAV